MKLTTLAALLLAAPLVLAAQTDAMPPRTDAPHQNTPGHVTPAVKQSRTLTVSFHDASTVLTLTDLVNLPQVTITVRDGHTDRDVTFTGPLVSDVLAKAGLVGPRATRQSVLHSLVVATGERRQLRRLLRRRARSPLRRQQIHHRRHARRPPEHRRRPHPAGQLHRHPTRPRDPRPLQPECLDLFNNEIIRQQSSYGRLFPCSLATGAEPRNPLP